MNGNLTLQSETLLSPVIVKSLSLLGIVIIIAVGVTILTTTSALVVVSLFKQDTPD